MKISSDGLINHFFLSFRALFYVEISSRLFYWSIENNDVWKQFFLSLSVHRKEECNRLVSKYIKSVVRWWNSVYLVQLRICTCTHQRNHVTLRHQINETLHLFFFSSNNPINSSLLYSRILRERIYIYIDYDHDAIWSTEISLDKQSSNFTLDADSDKWRESNHILNKTPV